MSELPRRVPRQYVPLSAAYQVKHNSMDDVSDGFHTFGELYEHRRALTAALVVSWPEISWRSKNHHQDDKPIFEGYFIVGINLPNIGQVSYHYKLHHWDDFKNVIEIANAPKWDGHTPQLTVERLLEWAKR